MAQDFGGRLTAVLVLHTPTTSTAGQAFHPSAYDVILARRKVNGGPNSQLQMSGHWQVASDLRDASFGGVNGNAEQEDWEAECALGHLRQLLCKALPTRWWRRAARVASTHLYCISAVKPPPSSSEAANLDRRLAALNHVRLSLADAMRLCQEQKPLDHEREKPKPVDTETSIVILRLASWLRECAQSSALFVPFMWAGEGLDARLSTCVHSPAYLAEAVCFRRPRKISATLAAAASLSNTNSTLPQAHYPGSSPECMARRQQAELSSAGSSKHVQLRSPTSSGEAAANAKATTSPPSAQPLANSPPSSASTSGMSAAELADEVDAAVRRANTVRTRMMEFEKCSRFIMNPSFGTSYDMPTSTSNSAPLYYYCRDRVPPVESVLASEHSASLDSSDFSNGSSSAKSGVDNWAERFPMHYCAYMDDVMGIKRLLSFGHEPSKYDIDTWTPLHYASWYGKLDAVNALATLGGAKCNVNAANRSGYTPLHMAARCGYPYVVELLLTHPQIKPDAKDKDGKTPLDLCESVPKADWAACASLLRAALSKEVPKITVERMDGTAVMLPLSKGADTTASMLLQHMLATEKLPKRAERLFALWICDDELELQLKGDHKPLIHKQRWADKLAKFSDIEHANEHPSSSATATRDLGHDGKGQQSGTNNNLADSPRLVFRRQAHVSLAMEQRIKMTPELIDLLFKEAEHKFLAGLCPCSEKDAIHLSSLLLQTLLLSVSTKTDRSAVLNLLTNEHTRKKIVPLHRLNAGPKAVKELIGKIASQHKHIAANIPRNIPSLHYQFLSYCWKLKVYGATFFKGLLLMQSPVRGVISCYAGVNDCGLHLVRADSRTLVQSHDLNSLTAEYKPGTDYIEFHHKNALLTLQTKKAQLLNTLFHKVKESVQHGDMGDVGVGSKGSRSNVSQGTR